MTGVSGWLRESLAAAVRSTGRAQVLLARDTGLSEKHVSQMLTGRVTGSLEAWEDLLAAANVSPANLLAQPTADEAEAPSHAQGRPTDAVVIRVQG